MRTTLRSLTLLSEKPCELLPPQRRRVSIFPVQKVEYRLAYFRDNLDSLVRLDVHQQRMKTRDQRGEEIALTHLQTLCISGDIRLRIIPPDDDPACITCDLNTGCLCLYPAQDNASTIAQNLLCHT